MANRIKGIMLNAEEVETLKKIMRQSTVKARVYIRAKILQLKAASWSNESIAEKLDTTVPTVRLCLDKYREGGLDAALHDRKGRGRKAEITDADIIWVISKACRKPKECGLSAEHCRQLKSIGYIFQFPQRIGSSKNSPQSRLKV